VVLSANYVSFQTVEAEKEIEPDPRHIDSLLNKKKGSQAFEYVLRRRKEIHDLFAESAIGKTVLVDDSDFSE
jgi:hypothetical protein